MNSLLLVREIASEDFLRFNKNESLINLVKEMGRRNVDRALIYRERSPEGIVTKKDIVTKVAMSRVRRYPVSVLHVSSVMSSPLITVRGEATLSKAANIMMEKNISSLPVREGNEITALLTKWNILEALSTSSAALAEVMTQNIVTVKDTDSMLIARKLMVEEGYSSLPVVSGERKVVGIVTLDEVLDALVSLMNVVGDSGSKSSLRNVTVRDIMRPLIPALSVEDTVGAAASLMLEKRVRATLIMSREGLLRGIVTLTDLTRHASRVHI
ncbi:MAG: CBS domain-containing protein [Zestosphaera sp.]